MRSRRVRLWHIVQLTNTSLLAPILPRLPCRILIRAPANKAQHHTRAKQQERDQSAVQCESALAADGTEVAVAHIGG